MRKNGFVTIFTADGKGDFRIRTTCPGWIYRKHRLRNIGGGVHLCDNFDVRIPLDALESVAVGDLICFGKLTQAEFAPGLCRKVASVSRNNFGSQPHWHLEAEYQYR